MRSYERKVIPSIHTNKNNKDNQIKRRISGEMIKN